MFFWACSERWKRLFYVRAMAFLASCSPCQTVFTIQIRSIYKYLSWFFSLNSPPDEGLVLASKWKNQKQTWKMPCSKGRDWMSEHGLKLKKPFFFFPPQFIPLCCNYPITVLIFPAANIWFYVCPCYVKTALPQEEMLCLTWFSLQLEDPQPWADKARTGVQSPAHDDKWGCCHKDIICNPMVWIKQFQSQKNQILM